MVAVPTWQCERRCRYCSVPKQDGRVMTTEVLDRVMDLMLSSDGRELELHFFGGEPFLEWDLLAYAVRAGTARAAAEGRVMRFMFTTNGVGVSEQQIRWLSNYDVRFQISLDGTPDVQRTIRRGVDGSYDPYAIATHADWFAEHWYEVFMVAHPDNVHRFAESYAHIVGLGWSRIRLNFALGLEWTDAARAEFARQLMAIGDGGDAEIMNLSSPPGRIRTHIHPSVDYNGEVFGSTAFLYLPEHRDRFRLGDLSDGRGANSYLLDGLSRQDLLDVWYRPEVARSNDAMGAVMDSFVRWRRKRDGVRKDRPGRSP
jgi:hypothetical protein